MRGMDAKDNVMADPKDQKTETDPREPGRKVPVYQSDCDKEDEVERESEDSFPASDAPSYTPISHPGRPHEKREKH
jgi:hypothetical protein